jgi:hypothetical protein
MKNIRTAITTFLIGLFLGTAGFAIATGSLGSSLFPDVPAGSYYDEAVGEMYDAGIIRGYSDGKYGPNDNVTRGQVAVMLKRFRDELLHGGIATVQPQDDDPQDPPATPAPERNSAGSIRFTIGSFDVMETNGTAQITIIRTGGAEGVVSVDIKVEDKTASGGSDYERTTGVLTFAEGETNRTFTVRIFDDVLEEGDETISITLSNPTGGAEIGTPSTAILIIEDDESADDSSNANSNSPGELVFNATQFSMSEEVGEIDITVVRKSGSGGIVSVDYQTRNGSANSISDYDEVSGTLSFADGETEKAITVPITDDANTEGLEAFSIVLSNPGGGASLGAPTSVDVKIIDDEVLSFGTGSLRLSEESYSTLESSGEALVTVERIGGASGIVSVHYSTSNGSAKKEFDYTETEGDLIFLAGESEKTIVIPILDDDLSDPGETLNINLSTPTNGAILVAPENATVNIQ